MIGSKEDMFVSVAMASYNGEKYIREQIESIFAQTHRHIELIITDDASTDDTVAVIKEMQLKYPLIRLFPQLENKGVNKTFEHSIVNCSGEFIAIADQDDIWEKDKIEVLLDNIGNADAIFADALLVDAEGRSMQKNFHELMNLQSYHSGAPFLMGNCVPGHGVLMKRDFAKRILPFPDTMMFDRWISFCAAAGNGINYIEKSLVKYRQHDSNVVGMGKSKEQRPSKEIRFNRKLAELKSMEAAPIKDEGTKKILHEMLSLFHRKFSFRRSAFFFRHFNEILVIKRKSTLKKIMYCIKMAFKPNY